MKNTKTQHEQEQAWEESNQRKGKAQQSKQTTKQQKEWNTKQAWEREANTTIKQGYTRKL